MRSHPSPPLRDEELTATADQGDEPLSDGDVGTGENELEALQHLPADERRKALRRLRNRESARRVRARRLAEMNSMEGQVTNLHDENASLKVHVAKLQNHIQTMTLKIYEVTAKYEAAVAENAGLRSEIQRLRRPGAIGENISPWTAPAASGGHASGPNALMAMDAQGPGCDMSLITANNLNMGSLLSAGHMQLRNSATVDVKVDPRREALDEVVQLLHEHKRRSQRPTVQDRSGNTGSSDVGSIAPGTTTSMAAGAATTTCTAPGTSLLNIAAPTASAPAASGAVTGGHSTPSPGLEAPTGAGLQQNRLLPLLGGLGYDAPTHTPGLTNAAGGAGSNRVSFESLRGSSGLVNNLAAAASGGGPAPMESTGAGAAAGGGSQLAASGSGTGNDLAGLGVTGGGGGVTLPSGGSGAGLRSRGSDVLLNHMAQLQAQLQAQSLQQQQQQLQQRLHPLCQLGLSASLDSAMAGQLPGGFGSVQGASQLQQQHNTTGPGSMSSAATTIAGYGGGMGQRDAGPASQPMPHLSLHGHGQGQQQQQHHVVVPLMHLSFEEQLRQQQQQQQQLPSATNLFSESGMSQFFTAGSLVQPGSASHGNLLQQQQQGQQEPGGEAATWRRLMQQQPHREPAHQQHGAALTLDRLKGGHGHGNGNGGGRGMLQLGAGADMGGGGAVAHPANVVGLHPGWGNGGLLGLGLGLGACSGPASLRPEDIPEDLFMSLDDFVPQDL